ncbi:MAG: O-succinylbenzoate synthase [Rhodothermales bacterium]|jgi:O-succinylbenzoate synthase
MILRRLSVHPHRLAFRRPWHTATGIVTHAETILLRAESADRVAWVETCPLFAANSVTLALAQFANQLIGKDIAEIQPALAKSANDRFVHAGLELIPWALDPRPLREAVGGADLPIPCARVISMHGGIDAVLGRVAEAAADDVPRVKLKIAPGHDLDLLRPVRDAFPDLRILVDANAAYTLQSFPYALDDLGLDAIEQPVASIADSATLQRELRTPICLDESIRTPADAEFAIASNACRAITIKVGRVGGLGAALKIADSAHAAGMPCWVGSMLESPIGTAINLALASHPFLGPIHGVTDPCELYTDEALTELAALTTS